MIDREAEQDIKNVPDKTSSFGGVIKHTVQPWTNIDRTPGLFFFFYFFLSSIDARWMAQTEH